MPLSADRRRIAGPLSSTRTARLRYSIASSISRRHATRGGRIRRLRKHLQRRADSYNDIIFRRLPQVSRDTSIGRHVAEVVLGARIPLVPGRWLEMFEDSHGLATEGRLSKTTLGNDLEILIQDEAVDALSIGFSIPEGGARWDSKGVRIISDIDLFEISLVSLPANPRARLTPGKSADPLSAYFGSAGEATHCSFGN